MLTGLLGIHIGDGGIRAQGIDFCDVHQALGLPKLRITDGALIDIDKLLITELRPFVIHTVTIGSTI